jgi:hypothetical protein
MAWVLVPERVLVLVSERALVLVSERAVVAQPLVAQRRVLQAWEWAGAPPSVWLYRSALALAPRAREG